LRGGANFGLCISHISRTAIAVLFVVVSYGTPSVDDRSCAASNMTGLAGLGGSGMGLMRSGFSQCSKAGSGKFAVARAFGLLNGCNSFMHLCSYASEKAGQ